ncbi:MAG: hypothetical protein PVH74_07300 [Desulfobacterales bacterium]|jgi:predicted nucleotidyltransferase
MGVEGYKIKMASLEKNIRSKKTLGRPRDKAVLDILEKTLSEKKDDAQLSGGLIATS